MNSDREKYGSSERSFCLIGLTGGVGAGKSTVLNLFKQEGAVGLSTDEVVHSLYEAPELVQPLVERWGKDVVAPNGELLRNKVAEIVFTDLNELDWLEKLLWPHVEKEIELWIAKRESSNSIDIAVIEVPLLFESGIDGRFDKTVTVSASTEVIEPRLRDRDGQLKLQQRMDRQLPPAEKAKLASHVIENNGSITDLSRAVCRLIEEIVESR